MSLRLRHMPSIIERLAYLGDPNRQLTPPFSLPITVYGVLALYIVGMLAIIGITYLFQLPRLLV